MTSNYSGLNYFKSQSRWCISSKGPHQTLWIGTFLRGKAPTFEGFDLYTHTHTETILSPHLMTGNWISDFIDRLWTGLGQYLLNWQFFVCTVYAPWTCTFPLHMLLMLCLGHILTWHTSLVLTQEYCKHYVDSVDTTLGLKKDGTLPWTV